MTSLAAALSDMKFKSRPLCDLLRRCESAIWQVWHPHQVFSLVFMLTIIVLLMSSSSITLYCTFTLITRLDQFARTVNTCDLNSKCIIYIKRCYYKYIFIFNSLQFQVQFWCKASASLTRKAKTTMTNQGK